MRRRFLLAFSVFMEGFMFVLSCALAMIDRPAEAAYMIGAACYLAIMRHRMKAEDGE